ncbi:MAG: carboxypeptidase regulatory-like domain-containing protein [Phycisphaerae bacterium]|nr:carboxypeptidase regulatory-like domain-containing protein [Gemmatimonadaceae bacterium]
MPLSCSTGVIETVRERPAPVARIARRLAGFLLVSAVTAGASVVAMAYTANSAHAQVQAEVIRGRITGPDSQPIVNALVTTVSFNGGITKTKRTDKNGRYSITYPNGEGDYWVSITAIGYQPQRFEVKKMADEEVLIADVKLSNTQQLAQVTVTADGPRQTPGRTDFMGDVTGGDRYVSNLGLAPELAGNLAAMAANTPGVQLIPGVDGNPDMFSILGLDGSQNNTALNGQQGGMSNLPRDASVNTTVRTGYDVANGGFSGAQVNVSTFSGSNYISRMMSGVFNSPQAQFNDRVGQASEYSYVSIGGRASGAIVTDKDFYTTSFQFDRRSQDLATLLSTSPVVFQSAGISGDSVARLTSILGNIGIPISTRGVGNASSRTNASLLGSFDWAPKSEQSGHAFNLAYNGGWNSVGPQAIATSQTPASLGESKAVNGSTQLRHTNFFGSILTESMLAFSASRNESKPFLELPGGTVLLTSKLEDGTATARTLSFGGSANANSNSNQSLSARNMLSWFSGNSKHRIKLITELRADRSSADRATNLLGRYTYQSLADLEANRPSSFTRSLNAVNQNGSALVGALAIGDAWRPTRDVQVQYGLRLDANRFLTRPEENSAINTLFDVSNRNVPNGVYVSPRVGFSWLYGKASQIPFAEGFISGPRATIRGGVGVFQNVRGPDLATTAIANTGLPGSAQQLNCTGAATPIVEWDVLRDGTSMVPTQCTDGSQGTLFASSVPSVTLFAPNYAQEKSIRTNLQWSGAVLDNRFSFSVNGQYSYNMNQPDAVDLNFRADQKFGLAAEGARPVYVSPSSIDAASGLIASRDARIAQEFNAVTQLRSDLHSQSRQLSFTISPLTFSARKFRWNASYNYLNTVQQFRGFTSAAGSPLDIQSGTGAGPRHDFGYQLVYNLANAVTLTWNGRITSGNRYTPTVAGDVNGDGSRNDRAFIPDPASISGTPLAASLQSLIDRGSEGARSCLRSQLGEIADRNSCVGPWTMGNTTLRLAVNASKIRLPQRTTLSFTVSNPIGAADLLMHGADKLHGWGQTPQIDQSLLFVRGFDRQSGEYAYEVNQRFGSTRAAQTTSRTPVVVTMQLSVDFAPTRDWQNLRMQLDRGRSRAGAKMTEAAVRQYSTGVFPNPMARLLQVGEQMHLTRRQADSLATMSRRYTRLVDSLWTPAAKYLAALPKEYDRSIAQAKLVAARETAVGYLITVAPHIRDMLTKGQTRVLPSGIVTMLEPRYLQLMQKGLSSGGEFAFFF